MNEEVKESIDTDDLTKVCFWCGKPLDLSRDEVEKGEKCIILNYDYCDRCKKEQEEMNAIKVIGVTEEPIVKDMPPLVKVGDDKQGFLYPTGSTFLATEEFVKNLIPNMMPKDEGLTDEEYDKIIQDSYKIVLETRRLLIPEVIIIDIIKHVREAEKQVNDTVD